MINIKADSNLIEWLLFKSNISRYKISKDTGISESTLSRIKSGETDLKKVNFKSAHKLTEYAKTMIEGDNNGK